MFLYFPNKQSRSPRRKLPERRTSAIHRNKPTGTQVLRLFERLGGSALKAEDFEQQVMPHLDAAYNLAYWMTRSDADAQAPPVYATSVTIATARSCMLADVPNRKKAHLMSSAPMQNAQECDVLVVGGGPAGSTMAALLAERGRHVVLLEKDRLPRFHIGESLLPLNLPLFDRLGVAEGVRCIGVYKPGAEVVSDEHGKATTFHFANNPRLRVNHSYHVKRADFDKLLLDNSRRLGATVLEETRVTKVEFGGDGRTRVVAIGPDGNASPWFPRYVVDASGRDTLLASEFGCKRVDKRNNTAALFGHFRNVARREGDAEGMITIHLCENGWFWVIPLLDGVTSVGAVGNQAFFKTRKDNPDRG